MADITENSAEVRKAFIEHDRRIILSNVKVGCVIGIVLMPAGFILDHYVYTPNEWDFLKLRLLCSALIAVFWGIVVTPFGRKHPRKLGVFLALLPAFFISWMVYTENGSNSTYYAGLNLVLLVVGFVLHWTFMESLVAVSLVIAMYIGACLLHEGISLKDFANNLYFLSLTGVIVMVGSYVQSRARYREFALRYELNENRKALEVSLHQLKENEAQLVQSEKLASLGRMSAGIIHEINNPLNFATTGLFTLHKKGKLLPPEQQADYAEIVTDIEDGIKRVQAIVSDLRTFTHPGGEMIDEMPSAEILTTAIRFLSNELRDKVEIQQNVPAGHMVYGNKNKLIQVVVNLLQNSLDALGEKTFNNGEKATIWIEGRNEGGHSTLSVRDNGPGIDDQHVGKVFDPFFTTKDVGEGMGLGLSVCYKIMQQFNGRITVKTEVGKFCEFTLEFPAKG